MDGGRKLKEAKGWKEERNFKERGRKEWNGIGGLEHHTLQSGSVRALQRSACSHRSSQAIAHKSCARRFFLAAAEEGLVSKNLTLPRRSIEDRPASMKIPSWLRAFPPRRRGRHSGRVAPTPAPMHREARRRCCSQPRVSLAIALLSSWRIQLFEESESGQWCPLCTSIGSTIKCKFNCSIACAL